MPAQCEPWPEYTNTVPGLHGPSCGPTTPSVVPAVGQRLQPGHRLRAVADARRWRTGVALAVVS